MLSLHASTDYNYPEPSSALIRQKMPALSVALGNNCRGIVEQKAADVCKLKLNFL